MHSQDENPPQALLQAWGLASPPRRGPKARFELADVVSAAVELADDAGLDAVTLSELARRLGLTTTGLYRYVDSKDVLDELVVDAALGPAPHPRAGRARAGIRELSDALWSRYETHQWLAVRPVVRAPRCPNAYSWLAELVRALREAGDPRPVGTAIAIDTLVRGYAQQALASVGRDLDPVIASEIGRRHPDALVASGPRVEPKEDLDEAIDRLTAPQWASSSREVGEQ